MDGPIVPRAVISESARLAVERRLPLHDALPWAPDTAAGIAFAEEFERLSDGERAGARATAEAA